MRVFAVVVALWCSGACAKATSEHATPSHGAPTATHSAAAAQGSQASSASPSATPPVTSVGAPVAKSHTPGCDVAVEALLAANVYRGSPSSPMKYDSYKRDRAYARFAEGEDHGAEYLSCEWRVRVNGAQYRYKRASHSGPARDDLRSELCSERTEAEDTAKAIMTFTDACKDLHGGEYYGDVLEPIGSAAAATP